MRVVPVVDGGAYATALMDGGVWYVNGAEAVKVRGLPSDVFSIDVIPLADGGALAFASLTDKGPWLLANETATPIVEVTQLARKRVPVARDRAKALWVLVQHEAAKARAAEESADREEGAEAGEYEPWR